MKYEKKPISTILRSPNTVFTFKDISLLWGDIDKAATMAGVNYYARTGGLYSIRRGIYAKDKNYDKMELAVKIYTPAYISFETVLAKAGIVFQFYPQILVASYLTRTLTVDKQIYSYRKIKDSVLTSQAGIERKNNYAIASPERAFLDILYLNKDYHFDNPSSLDWEKISEILFIYDNKRMERKVKEYQKASKIRSE
jgi:hypothetical protein